MPLKRKKVNKVENLSLFGTTLKTLFEHALGLEHTGEDISSVFNKMDPIAKKLVSEFILKQREMSSVLNQSEAITDELLDLQRQLSESIQNKNIFKSREVTKEIARLYDKRALILAEAYPLFFQLARIVGDRSENSAHLFPDNVDKFNVIDETLAFIDQEKRRISLEIPRNVLDNCMPGFKIVSLAEVES